MSTTQNEKTPKEIIAATAAEPVSLEISLDHLSPEEIATGVMSLRREPQATKAAYVQGCILCDNTRNVPDGWYTPVPWVCNDCKEAVMYAKELLNRKGAKLFYD